jgi:hypothetical protein
MKNKLTALWLALICIVIFIFQNLIPGFTNLLILNQLSFSQPWRFLTSIFLHGSLIHLTYNLFALILFGLILEKLIGSKKFLIIFFLSGIFASLISVNFYNSSLGASGAIFGIIGTLAVIKPLMPVWAFGLILPMFLAAIFWIVGDLLGFLYASDNIGHLSHLAGLGLGVIYGLVLGGRDKKSRKKVRIPENKIRKWENSYIHGI